MKVSDILTEDLIPIVSHVGPLYDIRMGSIKEVARVYSFVNDKDGEWSVYLLSPYNTPDPVDICKPCLLNGVFSDKTRAVAALIKRKEEEIKSLVDTLNNAKTGE
jgi:hypothetical protein